MTLTEKARNYIKNRKGQWPEICAETGLSYHWVCKFAQGVIKAPSADLIEKVLKHEQSR